MIRPGREFAWRAALGFTIALICYLMIAGTQWIWRAFSLTIPAGQPCWACWSSGYDDSICHAIGDRSEDCGVAR